MILHVDMDAFYVSVEERDRPELRGRPVVVGGRPEGRGVVAAANYVARRYGVHSAMPMVTARRLCPELMIVPGRHGYYAEVSRQIHAIFQRYTPLIEPLSLDEAFLDATASERLFGDAVAIGRRIQQEIGSELGLSASVGVAPSKFVAKVASDIRKPGGLVVVEAQAVQTFLDPLPAGRLWGVGKVANRRLQQMGIETIGQLRHYPVTVLTDLFGKWGEHLWRLAHGIDPRTVVPDHEAKSLSHETTFEIDVQDRDVLRAWLMELTEQVAARLRRHRLRAQTVQLKLRFPDFRTITRAQSLPQASDLTQDFWRVVDELLQKNLPARHPGIRLLGMGLSGFASDEPVQAHLFDEPRRSKQGELDRLADQIQSRYGQSALRRGLGMQRKLRDDE